MAEINNMKTDVFVDMCKYRCGACGETQNDLRFTAKKPLTPTQYQALLDRGWNSW
eukprot:Pgem_evm1s16352